MMMDDALQDNFFRSKRYPEGSIQSCAIHAISTANDLQMPMQRISVKISAGFFSQESGISFVAMPHLSSQFRPNQFNYSS